MNNIENMDINKYKLTFSVSAEKFQEGLDYSFNKNQKHFNIKGFRKGKVPRQIIEKTYGVEVFYDDAFNFVLQDAYALAAEESKLEIVSRPEIDVVSASKEEGVVFTAIVYTKPEVKISDYKGLVCEKPSSTVNKDDVEEYLNREREKHSRINPVTDRAVKSGDLVNIDFEGFIDGVAFEGGSGENYPLEIGSGAFVPGFEDQLIGMGIDKEEEITIKFPDDYGAVDLAGKEAVFKVTIHEIKEKHLPEIDDELAKDVNIDGVETLDQLKDHIKANIKARKENENEQKFMNDIYQTLIKNSKIENSDALIKQEQEMILKEIEQNLQSQGLNFDIYKQFTGKDISDILEDIKPQAEERFKINAIVKAIIKEEELVASDEELEAELQSIADYYKKELDEVKNIFKGNMSRVENDILTRKAIDLVKDNLKK